MPRGGGLDPPRKYRYRPDEEQPDEEQPDEKWLDAPLDPNAPPEALLVQDIAKRLRKRVYEKLATSRGPKTIEDLAENIDGVSHQTIRNIIQGRFWPELATIARLERYFDRKLWGNAHMKPRGKPDDTTDSASHPQDKPANTN